MLVLAGWLVLSLGVPAWSATQLETSEVVAATPEAAALLPPAYTFTLPAAGDYVVTLSDLNNPAPLQSLQALVTRDLQVAAKLEFDYPTPPDTTLVPKTQRFTGTAGTYRVHVVGKIPSGGAAGMFAISVAPAAGGTAVLQESDSIGADGGPAANQSVLQTTFTIADAGNYQLALTDRRFPAALARTQILLQRQATTPDIKLTGVGTFNVPNAGETYELIVIATADTNLGGAGLYGVTITGGPSNSVIYQSDNAVGRLPPSKTVNVSTAGTYALALADLQFPQALTSFGAAVIQNNAFAGSVTGAGSSNLALAAGPAQLFVYSNAATTGALSVQLAQGSQVAYADAHIADASADATTPAIYSFSPSQPVAAGNYTLTMTDFRFPFPLASIDTAVLQGASVVHLAHGAGSESVALQAGPVRVLVGVTPPPASGTAAGNGLFALTLATQPGNALVFDGTQGVGGLFTSIPVNLPAAGRYDVTLQDFEFPERLRTSWLAITRGTNLVGQVIGSSSIQNLQFDAGVHVLNFLGQPAQNASYGTFGLKVADSVPPVVTLTASPATVTSGQTTTLTWSATNATSCTASGGWSGTKTAAAGTHTEQTAALTANTTFEIECVGSGGRHNASVTVMVTAPSSGGDGGGGGGQMDPLLLVTLLAILAVLNARGRRRPERA